MKIRCGNVLALGFALLLAMASSLVQAEAPAVFKEEIDHLIRYINDSGCAFQRNGVWKDSKRAAAHVRGKYDFLVKLGMIDSTADFIDKAATKSSTSGKSYEIKCANESTTPSNIWLNNELTRYRASQLK